MPIILKFTHKQEDVSQRPRPETQIAECSMSNGNTNNDSTVCRTPSQVVIYHLNQ